MINVLNEGNGPKAMFFDADLTSDARLAASGLADYDDFEDLVGIEILDFRKQLPGILPYESREAKYAASFDPEVDAWSSGRIGGGVAKTVPVELVVLVRNNLIIGVEIAAHQRPRAAGERPR